MLSHMKEGVERNKNERVAKSVPKLKSEPPPFAIAERKLFWWKPVCTGEPPGHRYGHSSTVVGSQLFIFGGTDGHSLKNSLYALDLGKFHWENYSITAEGTRPCHRYGHSGSSWLQQLIIFGGRTKLHHLNDIFVFSLDTCRWSQIECRGEVPARCNHSAVVHDAKLYVLGGEAEDGSSLRDLFCFDLASQT